MNAKNLPLKFSFVAMLIALSLWGYYGQGTRLGIDLRGGHSLTFQIKAEPGKSTADEVDLPARIITVLKERVDPQGLLNLEWRPLGSDRIEVRMPAAKDEAVRAKNAYFEALEQLRQKNIDAKTIRRLENTPAHQRAEQIARLTGGDARQTQALEAALASADAVKAARARLDQAQQDKIKALQVSTQPANLPTLDKAVDDAENALGNALTRYEAAVADVLKGNLDDRALQSILALYVKPGTKMPADLLAERKQQYASAKDKFLQAHGSQADQIAEIVRLYQAWADVRQPLDDPADLKRLIAKAGVLEFRIAPFAPGLGDPSITPTQLSQFVESLQKDGPRGLTDKGEKFGWFLVKDEREGYERLVTAEYHGQPYLLLYNQEGYQMLKKGDDDWSLTSARIGSDDRGGPAVIFELDPRGADQFAKLTDAHKGHQMAVVLDDEVYSAPTIQSTIGSHGQITMGKATPDEVDELKKTLQSGSLPGRLDPEPVAESTFGPALGQVNLDMAIQAGKWGLVAVVGFMLIYYMVGGAIANIALVLNILFLVGAMSWFNAVFTLPGIAGVILTIGMAVDANVLIYERLREEQERGLSVRMALKAAYEKAFSAIFDSNLTTMITCLILGWVGTEEVRGFAITLGMGVVFSMFTALVITRWVFQLLLEWRILTKPLSMMRLVKVPNFDWMGFRYVFWGISGAALVLGVGSLAMQKSDVWGIEFSAGTQATLKLKADTLIGGKLPDDRLVEDQFRQAAQSLNTGGSMDKLLATARVEKQIDPQKVQHFLRDYDANRDGRVSAEEWKTAKGAPQFFALMDASGDGVLESTELAALPDMAYNVNTTETSLEKIRDAAREAFGNTLDVRTRRDFTMVKGQKAPILGVTTSAEGPTPITTLLLRQVAPGYREDLADFEGGLLMVIDDIKPAISRSELAQRIREMRSMPDMAETVRGLADVDIVGLTPAGDDGFSAMGILVRPDAGAEVGLAFREAAVSLLTESLHREEAMVATNFEPAIAGETARLAIVAVVLSWIAIVAYLWLRFGSAQWGFAAVFCLVHDAIIVVGAIAASSWLAKTGLGRALGIESFKIDLTMVAAVLTVIGYSVNDTIVVFDRIRENRGKLTVVSAQVINASINQTLSRTILTGTTTLMVIFIMYVWGGPGIHAFSYALLVGISFGTYSSIAVAAPLLMGFRRALLVRKTAALPLDKSAAPTE